MSEPRRWAPRAQVDNITVTTDCVWVTSKTLFTAGAKQSALLCVITAGAAPYKLTRGNTLALHEMHTRNTCSKEKNQSLHDVPLGAWKHFFLFRTEAISLICDPSRE